MYLHARTGRSARSLAISPGGRAHLRVTFGVLIMSCVFLASCGTNSGEDPKIFHTSVESSQHHPMVAQYTITSGCSGQAMVEFGPDTNYGRSTAWYALSAGQPLTIQ